jgi:hypothetical protein
VSCHTSFLILSNYQPSHFSYSAVYCHQLSLTLPHDLPVLWYSILHLHKSFEIKLLFPRQLTPSQASGLRRQCRARLSTSDFLYLKQEQLHCPKRLYRFPNELEMLLKFGGFFGQRRIWFQPKLSHPNGGESAEIFSLPIRSEQRN